MFWVFESWPRRGEHVLSHAEAQRGEVVWDVREKLEDMTMLVLRRRLNINESEIESGEEICLG